MITLSRTKALQRLAELREDFRSFIVANYEHRAKDCTTCETKGACCLDAHFVNVRISRLDAEAICAVIDDLPLDRRNSLHARVDETVERFGLNDGGYATYSCPLFEQSEGCLVHQDAKPFACIDHACYERMEDVPPDGLLAAQEILVDKLNRQTYGSGQAWLPIPVAIQRIRSATGKALE